MQIYDYHPITKEFLIERTARLDPLETKKQGKPVFLMPANATSIDPGKPPGRKNEAFVFDESKQNWVVVKDHRGVYYGPTGGPVHFGELGSKPPPGLGTTRPPEDLMQPKWSRGRWVEGVSKADIKLRDNELKIEQEMRSMAVKSLISRGELPANYK